MKLYDYHPAPNPRRVRMFLAEKGVDVPLVQVDLREKAQFDASFSRISPGHTVPVLELDDGRCLWESVAICRYFEVLHPEPNLMGRDALEQATVEMWQRFAEFQGLLPGADAFRNSLSFFTDHALPGRRHVPQIPELAKRGRESLARFYQRLDARLAESEYLAGPRFTIADITVLVSMDFATRMKLPPPEGHHHVLRWHETVSARPSAGA